MKPPLAAWSLGLALPCCLTAPPPARPGCSPAALDGDAACHSGESLQLLQAQAQRTANARARARRSPSQPLHVRQPLGSATSAHSAHSGVAEYNCLLLLLAPAAVFVVAAASYLAVGATAKGDLVKPPEEPPPEQGAERATGLLASLAPAIIRHRVAVLCCWSVAALAGLGGSSRLPSVVTNSIRPVPGMPSYAANARFEAAFPGRTRGAEFAAVLKVDPPSRITEVRGLPYFAALLQARLNVSGRLTSFDSAFSLAASLDFKGVGVGRGAFVSPDETMTTILWTLRDDFDSLEAANFATESRQVLDRLVQDHLKGISFHGQIAFADVINSALDDVERLIKECFLIVVPTVTLILWYVIGRWKLLLIPVANLLAATSVSFGVMYAWSFVELIHITTPNMMMCMLVSMTMDYSLFLLTRFQDELSAAAEAVTDEGALTAAQQVERALAKTLQTAGHTVVASGLLLFTPLLSLTLFPLGVISCLGVGSSVSLLAAVLSNLTLGPAILVSFPSFFAVGATAANGPGSDRKPAEGARHSAWWAWVAMVATTWPGNAIIVLAVLVLCAVAAVPAHRVQGANSLDGFMPRGTDGFVAFSELRDAFGLGMIAPYKVLLTPRGGATVLSRDFWRDSERVVGAIHSEFPEVISSASVFPSHAFGLPLPWLAFQGCIGPDDASLDPAGEACKRQALVLDRFTSADRNAAWGYIWTRFDPFSQQGVDFVQRFRGLAAQLSSQTPVDVTIVGNGADSADVISKMMSLFPKVALVTLAGVLVVCGVLFRSVLIPVWQSLTIATTLLFAYGLTVMVYQDDALGQLQVPSFSGKLGAMPWISPVVAFPFVTGICLDYDVFLLTRVTELRAQGLEPLDAIRRGLSCTGGIISIAGVIMAGTFVSLLFSSMLFMNCGAFCMVVAALFDTFFIRTLVVPAAMSLAGRWQWWPSALCWPSQRFSGPAKPHSGPAKPHSGPAKPHSGPAKLHSDPHLRARRFTGLRTPSAGTSDPAGQPRAAAAQLPAPPPPAEGGAAARFSPVPPPPAEGAAAAAPSQPPPPQQQQQLPPPAEGAAAAAPARAWKVAEVEVLRQLTEEAGAVVLRWLEEVDAGVWGEPAAGSPAEGLIYSKLTDDMPTRAWLAVLEFSEAQATLEEMLHNSTIEQICRYMTQTTSETFGRVLYDFAPNLRLLGITSRRGALGLELERCGQDIQGLYAPLPGDDRSGRLVSTALGTHGDFVAEGLQRLSPALAESLAKTALEEFAADTIFVHNHLSGSVVEPTGPGTWRIVYVLQMEPNVPKWLPRWGIEFSQRMMIQDIMAGIVGSMRRPS